jgi:hypothetical protein
MKVIDYLSSNIQRYILVDETIQSTELKIWMLFNNSKHFIAHNFALSNNTSNLEIQNHTPKGFDQKGSCIFFIENHSLRPDCLIFSLS